jgi:cytochrome o ubiquinol oxidase operon protein cyoD
MSAEAELHHDGHAATHASRRGYLTGFGLSVLLTAVPFWLVMSGAIANNQVAAAACMGLALLQIVVHMIFFLHMNTRSESGWTIMALIFTIVLIVIALSGSLWVMYHLTTNMMPMSPTDMKQMP